MRNEHMSMLKSNLYVDKKTAVEMRLRISIHNWSSHQ